MVAPTNHEPNAPAHPLRVDRPLFRRPPCFLEEGGEEEEEFLGPPEAPFPPPKPVGSDGRGLLAAWLGMQLP